MSKLGLTILVTAMVSGAAHAQDGCSEQLQQVQQQELAVQRTAGRSADGCGILREALKVDKAYAAFYRRCYPGIEGQIKAQEYDRSAAARESLLANGLVCGGRGAGNYLR
jgi:hypothetical protein